MNKKPLTLRERKCAWVAADLLLKGSPTTRIAKYCLEQNMTEIQIRTFCDKLADQFGVDIGDDVNFAVWRMGCGKLDYTQIHGKRILENLNI